MLDIHLTLHMAKLLLCAQTDACLQVFVFYICCVVVLDWWLGIEVPVLPGKIYDKLKMDEMYYTWFFLNKCKVEYPLK